MFCYFTLKWSLPCSLPQEERHCIFSTLLLWCQPPRKWSKPSNSWGGCHHRGRRPWLNDFPMIHRMSQPLSYSEESLLPPSPSWQPPQWLWPLLGQSPRVLWVYIPLNMVHRSCPHFLAMLAPNTVSRETTGLLSEMVSAPAGKHPAATKGGSDSTVPLYASRMWELFGALNSHLSCQTARLEWSRMCYCRGSPAAKLMWTVHHNRWRLQTSSSF